jgi:hypothetical protein
LRKELQHLLRELSEIVQMILQVIINAFYIYLCVDMDKKVAKLGHLHQRVSKRGWKDFCVTQEFNGLGIPSAKSATR